MDDSAAGSKKFGILSVLVVAVVLLAVALFIKFKPAKTPSETHQPTLQETKDFLLKDSTFNHPENTAMVIVSESAVPPGLKFLVPDNVEGVLRKRGTQQNGQAVYKISFAREGSFLNAYRVMTGAVRAASGWRVLRASRANLFAVIEAENATYTVRANLTPKEGITDVVIDVIQK